MCVVDASEPRWFGAPILPAVFSRRLRDLCRALLRNEPILIFNVGILEAILALLPLRGRKVCCLHQWLPLGGLPIWKRFVYWRLLSSARLIVTYSQRDRESLQMRYPSVECAWIGHFTDTAFFDPGNGTRDGGEKYYLCAGDHKRLEAIISEVSNRLDIKIIRFSTNPDVAAFHRINSPRVECLTGISFEHVKRLYAGASLVLNAVDDSLFPAGITTFCEAIAMGRPVITSGGHSCSGYDSENVTGFEKVVGITSADEWIEKIEKVEREIGDFDCSLVRAIALKSCSFDSMRCAWDKVKDRLLA